MEGESDEGENVLERAVIIDWASRTRNRWMDDEGRDVKDEWGD